MKESRYFDNGCEVMVTDEAAVAFACQEQQIPYIVLLQEHNREESFPMGAYCVENPEDIDDVYLRRVYQRAKGLPWEITQTERLILRELTVADVPRLYELYEDEQINRFVEPLYQPMEKEIEYTQAYIKNVYHFYGYGIWAIILKETGELIGRAGIEYKEGFDGLELGFMLGKQYWHKGYAREACEAVLIYGREMLEEYSYRAIVHEENEASKKLCERLGFALCRENVDSCGRSLGEEDAQERYVEFCIEKL